MAEGPVLQLPGIELHTLQAHVLDIHNRVSDNRGGSVPTTKAARLQCQLAPGEAARAFDWMFDHLGATVAFTLTSATASVTGEVLVEDNRQDGWIDWHVNRLDP